MRGRLLVVMTLAAALLGPASPAWAAPGSVTFVRPNPSAVQGKVASGPMALEVSATPPTLALGLGLATVKDISLKLQGPGTGAQGTALGPPQQGKTFSGTWNPSAVAYNGSFDIEATATFSSGNPATAALTNLLVNNPAARPARPDVTLQENAAVVTWSKNPEPDILSYRISRSPDGGAFTQVAVIAAGKPLSFTDSQAPLGVALKYQVVAIRTSPVAQAGIASDPSPESAPVTIAAPAPAVVTDASGNPVPVPGAAVPGVASPLPPAPAAKPIPSPISLAPFPIKKGAPPPVFKSRPSEIAFAPTLPFGQAPPAQPFDTAAQGSGSTAGQKAPASSSGLSNTFTATNPVRFVLVGIVLLAASVFLARTARRLLKASGPPEDFLSGADFTGLGDIHLPEVDLTYPQFKAFRS